MRLFTVLTTTALLAATTACTPTGDPSAFAQVLPDERVQINLPTDTTARRDANWAEYYVITAQVTDDVNGMITGILGSVGAVTELPPTWSDTEDNTAVWGPFAEGLDAAETVVWVHHDLETDEYSWAVGQRPRGTEDEWTQIVGGVVDAGATHEASSGYFVVDFTAASLLDPTSTERGTFSTEYDLTPTGLVATAGFEGYADGPGTPVDAWYHYDQTPDGAGAMDLVYAEDAYGDPTVLETQVVRSRWVETGAGRSDVYVYDGDLGDQIATGSQCWGTTFEEVYFEENWSGDAPVGDLAACAFDTPEYNEFDDIPAR